MTVHAWTGRVPGKVQWGVGTVPGLDAPAAEALFHEATTNPI
jgi:hypothetical protein